MSRAVVVATGITAKGGREVLGVDIGDSEDETFWTRFLRSLKARGLGGVRLVISDAHAGLKASIRKCFSGASWQRCRVHYVRNLLAVVPKASQEMVAAAFRSIFALTDPDAVEARWDEVTDSLAERFPKAGESMREARSDVLAFRSFPTGHWRKIWSNNPLERLNKEIKRRSNVVGIFPNDPAVLRLIGGGVGRPARRVGHRPPLPLGHLDGRAHRSARHSLRSARHRGLNASRTTFSIPTTSRASVKRSPASHVAGALSSVRTRRRSRIWRSPPVDSGERISAPSLRRADPWVTSQAFVSSDSRAGGRPSRTESWRQPDDHLVRRPRRRS